MAAIEVRGLKKYFGNKKAIDGITFDVAEGEIFSFLGPNGAGKTTAIRCMMDFIRPTEGSIKILGLDAQKDSVEVKKHLGYLSAEVRLYNSWTGKEHVDFFKKLLGNGGSADVLVERLGLDLTARARTLSSGNRQKLGIVLALMTNPKVIILDEPTNGLDPLLQHTVYELLGEARKNGATIFMSSHNLSDVERVSDRVGIIRNGKMVATESITSLRKKHLYTAHVSFKKKVTKKEIEEPGLQVVTEFPTGFDIRVTEDLDRLVKKLAKFQVDDVEIEHAGLEEIFLKYYEK